MLNLYHNIWSLLICFTTIAYPTREIADRVILQHCTALHSHTVYKHIYIYIYVCVCVCVCTYSAASLGQLGHPGQTTAVGNFTIQVTGVYQVLCEMCVFLECYLLVFSKMEKNKNKKYCLSRLERDSSPPNPKYTLSSV